MIPLVAVELAVAAATAAVFLVAYMLVDGPPWRQPKSDRVMAWHVLAFTAVCGAEAAVFLGLLAGWWRQAWPFVMVFAAMDAVLMWRLYLLTSRHIRAPLRHWTGFVTRRLRRK